MTYLSHDLLCPIRLELGGHEREVNDLEFKLEKVSAHHYGCVHGGPYLTSHVLSPRGTSLTTCEFPWLGPDMTNWIYPPCGLYPVSQSGLHHSMFDE